MDHAVNLEQHRKQSRSLHRAYLLVGVVGVGYAGFHLNQLH